MWFIVSPFPSFFIPGAQFVDIILISKGKCHLLFKKFYVSYHIPDSHSMISFVTSITSEITHTVIGDPFVTWWEYLGNFSKEIILPPWSCHKLNIGYILDSTLDVIPDFYLNRKVKKFPVITTFFFPYTILINGDIKLKSKSLGVFNRSHKGGYDQFWLLILSSGVIETSLCVCVCQECWHGGEGYLSNLFGRKTFKRVTIWIQTGSFGILQILNWLGGGEKCTNWLKTSINDWTASNISTVQSSTELDGLICCTDVDSPTLLAFPAKRNTELSRIDVVCWVTVGFPLQHG